MTAFYCPGCWAEVPEGSSTCPACGRSLLAGNEDFIDKLIAALRHPEPTRAALAVQILGSMLSEPRAILPLIDLIGSAQDAYVLKYAVEALGRFADARAAPALRQLLLTPTTPLVVRIASVDALARLSGEAAQTALALALRDPNATVRQHAREALRQRV